MLAKIVERGPTDQRLDLFRQDKTDGEEFDGALSGQPL